MAKGIKNKYDISKTRTNKIKYYEETVETLIKKENYKEALYYLNELLKHKDFVLYHISIALCYVELERYEEAIKSYIKIFASFQLPPLNQAEDDMIEKILSHLGFCFRKIKKYEESIIFFKKIKENEKGYIKALEEIHFAYVYLKNEEKIFEYFKLILKIDPLNKYTYNFMAFYYSNKNDFQKASEYLEKGKPESFDDEALYLIVTNVNNDGFYKKKIEYCNIYIKNITTDDKISANRHYEEILDELILSYYKTNDFYKTIEIFEKLKKLHDEEYDLYNAEEIFEYLDYLTKFAVISYIKVKRYDEGIKTIKSFIHEEYDSPKFYLFTGILYFFKNDAETSLKYLNKIQKSEEISFDFISNIIKNSKTFDFEKTKEYIFEFTNENEEFSQFYDEITNLKFDESFFQNIILKSLEMFEL